MSGANDWTREIETKGLPELKQHFAMLGVPDHVNAKYFNYPHNYNRHSRQMMYSFMNEHLNLGIDTIEEQDFLPLTIDEMTVFDAQHVAPAKTTDTEVEILRAMDNASRKQMQQLAPRDAASLAEYRRVVGGALEVMIGRPMPAAADVEYEQLSEAQVGGFRRYDARLHSIKHSEELPAVFLLPDAWNQQVVLWVDGAGKSGLFDAAGAPISPINRLIQQGYAIASVDLLYTGEFLQDGPPLTQARTVDNPREFAGYTLGYNHPLLAQRTHDVMTLVTFANFHPAEPEQIHLVGVNGAAFVCAATAALSGDTLSTIAVDTEGYRFASITDIRDVNLLPGAVKYGDLPAFLTLCPPITMAISGESEDDVANVIRAGELQQSRVSLLPPNAAAAAIADWLMKHSQA
jgi:hypothetical protein